MEVVLSPGRFGDEVPGAPYQNEEIREWSHVDRLTGMLERARVETGRWKTLNQGSARSYGKVIDSRERNSADGSIVQRARRQVEVFQSEAPGRSVQVVRASQWSSSRVTDSSTTSPLAISSLAQKKINSATPERLVESKLNTLSPSLLLSRDEAISERLSSLLGSFAHQISSSTVPLRRIDSKYATRTPISRRSTSNDDLIGHSEKTSRDFLADKESLRDLHSSSCQIIKDKSKISRQIEDCLTNSEEETCHKIHEINVNREESRDYTEKLKIHEITVDRELSRDYKDRLGDSEDSATSENSQNVIAVDELRPTTNKAAIQLLPSSKANTTVVNLINDSNNSKPETMDIREGKRSNILSWVSPSSAVGEEATRIDAEETTSTTTTTTTTTTSTSATTTLASSRRESRIEESLIPFSPGRSVKRVGFCKTEIHFAADSGKVNIVETDEKPPPTNKFRRRKRNSLNGLSSNKNLAIVDTKDSLEQRSGENSKTKTDPNLHRGHTTSVNFGSDLSTKNEQNNRENGISTELMLKPIEKENNILAHSALVAIESEHVTQKEVCNVVCTDADNNQVLLKVVKTHEPTIARVEIDHLRNSVKKKDNIPVSVKKEKLVKKFPSSTLKKLQSHKEHIYVNVFTGSKRAPIYENYKAIDKNSEIVAENNVGTPLITDANSVIEKCSHVTDTKTKIYQSSLGSKSKEIDNTKLERIKVVSPVLSTDGKLSKDTEFNKTLIGNKKTRNKMKELKLNRTEGAICNINNHSNNSSRGRSVKEVTKNPTSRSSVSSGERGDEFSGGNCIHASVKNSVASKSTRDGTSAKKINKSEVLTKHKPIEVVYQTAVYNMKNEKLKKPQKGKESKGPRYLNELICGAKMKRPSDSKTSKTSSAAQNGANNKSALQPIKHWK